ncbi:MAG: CRTAC1 family protein [Paracoccaceae bacterium]
MMRLLLLLATLLPNVLTAQTPQFADRSSAFDVEHIYTGDWHHFVGGGVAVLDCNGDSKPDVFVAGGENPARLFVNNITEQGWHFSQNGFPPLTNVTGAYPLDFNNDAILDLMVLRVGENYLFQGQGDCKFSRTDANLNFSSDDRWTTAFSAMWEGGNTLPTLAVGNYVDRSNPDGPFGACDDNQIYRPEGDRYTKPKILTPGYCALSMLFSDWSRTGQTDLRVSNDRHYYIRDGSEQMWRPSESRFLTEEDHWQPISIWGMGIASQDITGDLRPDVVLTSMGDQLLQFATATGFVAAPFSTGTYAQRPFVGDDGRPSTGWHAEFGDVNNDGREDLFIAKGNVDQMPGLAMLDPNNLLVQNSDGSFSEMADQAGVATLQRSRGAALADFDGDGKLDLVVTNRRAPVELYQNVTPTTGNWIAVTPRQSAPNTFAIGAWIELRDETGRVRTKELTVGGGHASGQFGPIHFGVGRASSVDIRILWPDGVTSDWINLVANQSVSLWRNTSSQLERRPI